MKLTIEHIAAYLPHNLKFEYKGKIMTLRSLNEKCTLNLFFDGNICKPILRPLSDLTKEIENNGEKFVPLDYLYYFVIGTDSDMIGSYHDFVELFMNNNLDYVPYVVIKKLFEWHFDVSGLIENNLAIDKNTITKGIVSDVWKLNLETLMIEVSDFTGIPIEKIMKRNRKREFTDARSIFMHFAFLYSNYSGITISEYLFMQHCSVVYAGKKCNSVIKTDFEEFEKYMHEKYELIKINRNERKFNRYEKY